MPIPSLKLLLYKNINSTLVTVLRQQGHDVFYAPAADQSFTADTVCQKANRENYILMTADEDLADEAFKNKKVQTGIICLKVKENDDLLYAKAVTDAIDDESEGLKYHYSTITKQGARGKKPLATV